MRPRPRKLPAIWAVVSSVKAFHRIHISSAAGFYPSERLEKTNCEPRPPDMMQIRSSTYFNDVDILGRASYSNASEAIHSLGLCNWEVTPFDSEVNSILLFNATQPGKIHHESKAKQMHNSICGDHMFKGSRQLKDQTPDRRAK